MRVLLRRSIVWFLCVALVAGCASISLTGAPSEVRTEVRSPTEAMLQWKTDKDAGEYRVERKDGPDAPFALVGVTGPGASSHLNSGLTPSATYVWRVRACIGDRCSPYSPEISAKMPA